MDAHLSRWNLLPTLLMLSVLAAGCRDVVEPRDAKQGSPRIQFTAFDPSKADSATQARAARWAQAGDSALLHYVMAERNTSVDLTGDRPMLSYVPGAGARWGEGNSPNWSLAASSPETALPLNPSNWRRAEIYNHSVTPFISGRNGVIVGKLTFSGNWAKTQISLKAYTNGTDLIPARTVTKEGKSNFAACMGDGCWHVFDLNTSVDVDVGRSCGAYLHASGSHEAAWSALAIPHIAFLGAWGQVFAVSAFKLAYNGDCTQCGQMDASRVGSDGQRANLSCSAGDGDDDGGYDREDDGSSGSALYALQICKSTDYYHPVTMHFMYSVPGTCRIEYHLM